MRGTVAKRLRRFAQSNRDQKTYVYENFAAPAREIGMDEETILRKFYRRAKVLHKWWRRYPNFMGPA